MQQSHDNNKLSESTGSKSPSSITPVPSPTSRGLVGFFRRRRKSTSSNNDNDYNELDVHTGMENTNTTMTESIKQKPSPTEKMSASGGKNKDVYGNYATVSGTGANLLKDMFNKKYRTSVRLSGNFTTESEKTRKTSHSSPLGTLFKFRSKKDIIKEERSPSPPDDDTQATNNNASNNSNDKQSQHHHHHKPDMHRSRHISIGSDARKFVTPSSSKLGGLMPTTSNKVRGFFDSFRQKSSRETTPEVAAIVSPSATQNSMLGTTIVYAPGSKKKKKFRVTKALEDDPTQFGPNNFIEMYRKNRADSESKRANRMHQLSSSPTFSKASTIHSYEPLHLVIWRDKKKGTRVFKLPKTYTDSLDFEEYPGKIVDSEELALTRFANTHPCYDLMPASCKLVVFDINLNVSKAFYALVQNSIRSAPLWSLDKHDFAGLLTVTDFLRVLQKYYHSPELDMKEIEDQKISNWKDLLGDSDRPTIQVEPDTSLLASAAILARHNIHHLPVVEPITGNILFVLTSKRILRFIASYMRTLTKESGRDVLGNQFLQQTVEESQIGTYEDVAHVNFEMTLVEAVDMFMERNVSALPIINEKNQVIDVYNKSDVFSIADDQMYTDLSVTIRKVIEHKREESQNLQTCTMSERVCDVINRMVDTGTHCLVVVSDRKELKGIISISDVLNFLILKPFYKYRDQAAEKQKLLIQQHSSDALLIHNYNASEQHHSHSQQQQQLQQQQDYSNANINIITATTAAAAATTSTTLPTLDEHSTLKSHQIRQHYLDNANSKSNADHHQNNILAPSNNTGNRELNSNSKFNSSSGYEDNSNKKVRFKMEPVIDGRKNGDTSLIREKIPNDGDDSHLVNDEGGGGETSGSGGGGGGVNDDEDDDEKGIGIGNTKCGNIITIST